MARIALGKCAEMRTFELETCAMLRTIWGMETTNQAEPRATAASLKIELDAANKAVKKRRSSALTSHCEVDPDGSCNGKTAEEFLAGEGGSR